MIPRGSVRIFENYQVERLKKQEVALVPFHFPSLLVLSFYLFFVLAEIQLVILDRFLPL